MIFDNTQILFFLEALIFTSVILIHLSKKNSFAISLYMAQSLVVALFLLSSALVESSWTLALVAASVFIVKVIIAPHFFRNLIKKHQLKFSVSTYLNEPMTLIVLAGLTAFAHSSFFSPLVILSQENFHALLLAVATILISIFVIINRKGALSQMIGILSLENAIVSFAFLSGLEQNAGPQLGIVFDILVWVIIATVFASMIYKQFGTLDVSLMQNLKEE
jgi:hydrogenase-4 component E